MGTESKTSGAVVRQGLSLLNHVSPCWFLQVVNAFRAGDAEKSGVIPARQLRNLLQNWGEGLSAREVSYYVHDRSRSSFITLICLIRFFKKKGISFGSQCIFVYSSLANTKLIF